MSLIAKEIHGQGRRSKVNTRILTARNVTIALSRVVKQKTHIKGR